MPACSVIRRVWFAGILIFFLAPAAFAGTIGLSWDPSPGATGYRVYYGPSSETYYPTALYEGPATQTVISSSALSHCTNWYFAVTAYNASGESDYSDEVFSWPRPEVQSVSPGAKKQGSQFTMTITGGSFDPAASLTIDNPDVRIENATINCNQIQIASTVEPTAPGVQPALIGDFTVTVTNPNGLLGSKTEAFEVLINPARYDINRSEPGTLGRLDGLDTIWLSVLFGTKIGDAIYDPDYDFDGDGWVDGTELAYIGSNFGRCWNGTAWVICD